MKQIYNVSSEIQFKDNVGAVVLLLYQNHCKIIAHIDDHNFKKRGKNFNDRIMRILFYNDVSNDF